LPLAEHPTVAVALVQCIANCGIDVVLIMSAGLLAAAEFPFLLECIELAVVRRDIEI
jgi:hypothetical protein